MNSNPGHIREERIEEIAASEFGGSVAPVGASETLHLSSCEACSLSLSEARAVEQLFRADSALASMRYATSPDFTTLVMQNIGTLPLSANAREANPLSQIRLFFSASRLIGFAPIIGMAVLLVFAIFAPASVPQEGPYTSVLHDWTGRFTTIATGFGHSLFALSITVIFALLALDALFHPRKLHYDQR